MSRTKFVADWARVEVRILRHRIRIIETGKLAAADLVEAKRQLVEAETLLCEVGGDNANRT